MFRLGIVLCLSYLCLTVYHPVLANQAVWVNYFSEKNIYFTNSQSDRLNEVTTKVSENEQHVFFTNVQQISSKIMKYNQCDSFACAHKANDFTVFIAEEYLINQNLWNILKRIRHCHPYLKITEAEYLTDFQSVIKKIASLDASKTKKIVRFVRKTIATKKVKCESYHDLLDYVKFFENHIDDKSLKWYYALLCEIPLETPLTMDDFKKYADAISYFNTCPLSPGQNRHSMLSSSLGNSFRMAI